MDDSLQLVDSPQLKDRVTRSTIEERGQLALISTHPWKASERTSLIGSGQFPDHRTQDRGCRAIVDAMNLDYIGRCRHEVRF